MNEPILLTGGGLQIRFQLVGDRIAHTIAAIDGDRIVPLAASHEGTPDEEWPPSPAIQEINQLPGENQIAMLMGQTTQGYWSVTVELDAEAGWVVFDVACRVKSLRPSEVPTLSSGYRTMVAPTKASGQQIQLALGDAVVDIETLSIEETTGKDVDLMVDGEGFCLCPRELPTEVPQTLRWRYAVCRVK